MNQNLTEIIKILWTITPLASIICIIVGFALPKKKDGSEKEKKKVDNTKLILILVGFGLLLLYIGIILYHLYKVGSEVMLWNMCRKPENQYLAKCFKFKK